MSSRKIVFNCCAQCPHRSQSSLFSEGGPKPTCVYEQPAKELPSTPKTSDTGLEHVIPTFIIPSWCRLEKDNPSLTPDKVLETKVEQSVGGLIEILEYSLENHENLATLVKEVEDIISKIKSDFQVPRKLL